MRRKRGGFSYTLSEDTLKNYRKKPLDLRLRWLYMGNLLRMSCSKRVRKIQDRFRQGSV
jgi:hypothetical protein